MTDDDRQLNCRVINASGSILWMLQLDLDEIPD